MNSFDLEPIVSFSGASGANGFLSNTYNSPMQITVCGCQRTAKNLFYAFQVSKFVHTYDISLIDSILNARSPVDAKSIADNNEKKIVNGWIKDGLNVMVMTQLVLQKFSENDYLYERLIGTGNATIIEIGSDAFWSKESFHGSGRNVLGEILMKVRAELAKRNNHRLGQVHGRCEVIYVPRKQVVDDKKPGIISRILYAIKMMFMILVIIILLLLAIVCIF